MTLEEESRLSFYRELTVLDEKKNIVLVQDIRNSELCVKKTLDIYSRDVYEQLASVRIEGVPAVKECVADDGKLIVVEEYVQGRSLKQVLDEQGLLNEEQAYEIAVQLVDILVRLHQLESAIVHRDIKPSNIIIEKNGHVNLIDFNAARHVNADKNEDTRMLGIVYFAAPEQFGFGQSDELRGVLDMLNYSIVQDNRKKAETAFGKDNTVSVVRTYHNIRDIIVKMYRKYQKRNYDIDTSWRRYLLPGFRRLNVVYCLIALVWYAVIVWMTITFAVTDSKTGISVTGGELTMYKIAVFVLLFGMTMWFGNYLNIRRKLPGMKKINVLSTILTFGYAFTISFMFLAFFAIFMAIIGYL